MKYSEQANQERQKANLWLAGSVGRMNGEQLLNGHEFPFFGDENVLELSSYESCKYPWDIYFKTIKIANFMLYVFYNNNYHV